MPLHTHQDDYNQSKKKSKITNVKEDVKELEPLHIADGNVT